MFLSFDDATVAQQNLTIIEIRWEINIRSKAMPLYFKELVSLLLIDAVEGNHGMVDTANMPRRVSSLRRHLHSR